MEVEEGRRLHAVSDSDHAPGLRFGILLARLHPGVWRDAVVLADELGYESVWIADHLVLPQRISGELVRGEEHPPVAPQTPVFDVPAYLSYLAACTQHIRLGVYVYLLGIRHPFVTARGFATLDVVSNGRVELGVGAGWLENEWVAAGLDPRTRGRRLDECIAVCRRLWREPIVEHHGEFFDFEPVAFEPKPVQSPLPISVGGESQTAMRRAASLDGWMGLVHTPESAARVVSAYRSIEAAVRPDHRGLVSVTGECRDHGELADWHAAGVDRLIVAPWSRSRDALDALRRFAAEFL
jgi:probable F420-dependent oxidoreductase